MAVNFVSVSAVTDRTELKGVYDAFKETGLQVPIAIGYQVSNRSINTGTRNPRQPKFSELKDICDDTIQKGFIPAIHYYAKNLDAVLRDLDKITSIVRPEQALVQFNTLPLEYNALNVVKQMGFGIIFKVAVSNKQSREGGYSVWKGDAVQDVNAGNLDLLLDQVVERADIIDYAMFDPSHGTNLDLNLDDESLAIKFGKAIAERKSLDNLGLVYAGGIKSSNVEAITKKLISLFPDKPLLSLFPNRISIDIESGVRTDDKLDLNLVKAYFQNYMKAISQ